VVNRIKSADPLRASASDSEVRYHMVLARVIVADPPWAFNDKLPGKKRGAEKHYKCMNVSEIMRMPLPPIHNDAVLFLWRVSSMVEEAYQVIRAWDFVPKSEIVWNKTSEDGQKDALGMGRIVRGSHETCIVAARGKYIEPMSKSERTSFRAPRTEHSEKPEEFFRIVERLYPLELWPEAHVELFARRRRKGWISFGDELPPEAETVTAATVPERATKTWSSGWRVVNHIVARDEIEASREASAEAVSDRTAQPENLSRLVSTLEARAYDVPLPALTKMSPVQRGVLQAFLDQPDSDPPEFLKPFARDPSDPDGVGAFAQ
jgi:N6-adenosine-specific RNA methylase IME4